jgi:hypothetical protein
MSIEEEDEEEDEDDDDEEEEEQRHHAWNIKILEKIDQKQPTCWRRSFRCSLRLRASQRCERKTEAVSLSIVMWYGGSSSRGTMMSDLVEKSVLRFRV